MSFNNKYINYILFDCNANVNKPDNAVTTEISITLITVDKITPQTPTIESNIPINDNIFFFTSPHGNKTKPTINIL